MDENRHGYLRKEEYRQYNKDLFVELKKIDDEIEDKAKKIREELDEIERTKLEEIEKFLKNEKEDSEFDFFRFDDNDGFTNADRPKYFDAVAARAANFDLIFCDPDTGISLGTSKHTKQHVTFADLQKIWKIKKNILVYQSHDRTSSNDHVRNTVDKCWKEFAGSIVISFETSHMYFLLIASDVAVLEEKLQEIVTHWNTWPQKKRR